MYVLWRDLKPASFTTLASAVSPFFVARMIFCCAGQIRNHTLNAMIVPNSAAV